MQYLMSSLDYNLIIIYNVIVISMRYATSTNKCHYLLPYKTNTIIMLTTVNYSNHTKHYLQGTVPEG